MSNLVAILRNHLIFWKKHSTRWRSLYRCQSTGQGSETLLCGGITYLKLPEGYDTLIGENGSKLSGGERQRISIARALLKNAPILLLDEISASLDVENERKIQDALNRLIAGKTVIIVSHRLKSIEKVDQIVVMNAGKVDATGSHEELLEKSALYRRLIEKSRMTESFTY